MTLTVHSIYQRAAAYSLHPARTLHAGLSEWELDRFWTFVDVIHRIRGSK